MSSIYLNEADVLKLVDVLRWYGDSRNYERILMSKSTFEQYQPSEYTKQPVLEDQGKRARDMLARFECRD